MKGNKLKEAIAVVCSGVVLVFTRFEYVKISTNHQMNMQIIEACFENFSQQNEVMIRIGEGLSTVSCE